MPHFLTREELYRVIQRELPPDTYPDGQASAYWSTADSDATAAVLATFYANMARIHDNNFVQTADERLIDWEVKVYGSPLGGSLTTQQRRDRILGKLRSRPTLNPTDMRALIATHIGESGTTYDWEYVEWNVGRDGPSGEMTSWTLGYSQLGFDTYLGGGAEILHGDDACDLSASDLGITDDDLLSRRENAYTVELKVFDATLPEDVKASLQADLDRFGRASVDHPITDGSDVNLRMDAASGDFYLPMLDAETQYVHWVAEDANTVAETIASRGNVALTFTLLSTGTYTKPDTNHALTKGSSTKRKYVSGTGISSDNNLGTSAAIDLLNASNVLTIEAVFRLQAYTAFYFRVIRSGVGTQRFDLYVGYDDTTDGFYFLPLDYVGGVDEGQAGLRTLTNAADKGVVRVGEFCHFACMIDPRSTKPKFESYVNGEFIGRSQSTRDFTASYTGNNETFSITDNAGDDTYRSFMEVQLHNTPLTMQLARRKARYLRQLMRITEV